MFIGSGISGVPIERLFKNTLPLLAVMVIVLLLITYVEPIAMGLVWLLGAK